MMNKKKIRVTFFLFINKIKRLLIKSKNFDLAFFFFFLKKKIKKKKKKKKKVKTFKYSMNKQMYRLYYNIFPNSLVHQNLSSNL